MSVGPGISHDGRGLLSLPQARELREELETSASYSPGGVGRGMLVLTLVPFCRSPSSGMPRGATSRKSITQLLFFRMSWISITPPLQRDGDYGTAPAVPATAAAIKPKRRARVPLGPGPVPARQGHRSRSSASAVTQGWPEVQGTAAALPQRAVQDNRARASAGRRQPPC